jgi:hypothetical protein
MRCPLFEPFLASVQDLIQLFGEHLNTRLFFVAEVVNSTSILENG